MDAVKKKYKIFARYKNDKHPAYVKAEANAKRSLREARRSFECKLAANVKEDAKSFYSYARSKSKSRVGVGPLLSDSGVKSESDMEMCEAFNEYFTSVFTVEDKSQVPIPIQKFKGSQDEKLSDITITQGAVADKLAQLRAGKEAGTDELNPRYLKEIQTEICSPLLRIYQRSINDRWVPEDWKSANVCPIF